MMLACVCFTLRQALARSCLIGLVLARVPLEEGVLVSMIRFHLRVMPDRRMRLGLVLEGVPAPAHM